MCYTVGVITISVTTYWLEQQRYLLDIDARLLAAANNVPAVFYAFIKQVEVLPMIDWSRN
jgi:hypothetical protein